MGEWPTSSIKWSTTEIEELDKMSSESLRVASWTAERRKTICARMNMSFEQLSSIFGTTRSDISYHLFDSQRCPKFEMTVQKWKGVIHNYADWHSLKTLPEIVEMWMDIVDAFKSSPDFHSKASLEFKVWLYDCMCQFVLQQRLETRNKMDLS